MDCVSGKFWKPLLWRGSISNNLTTEENPDFAWLPIEERIVISKLAAIFRLANALDKSHRHKLRDLKIHLEDDQVIFKAKAADNTLLERWAFEDSAQFFKEVFGLSLELSIKFDMIWCFSWLIKRCPITTGN